MKHSSHAASLSSLITSIAVAGMASLADGSATRSTVDWDDARYDRGPGPPPSAASLVLR